MAWIHLMEHTGSLTCGYNPEYVVYGAEHDERFFRDRCRLEDGSGSGAGRVRRSRDLAGLSRPATSPHKRNVSAAGAPPRPFAEWLWRAAGGGLGRRRPGSRADHCPESQDQRPRLL